MIPIITKKDLKAGGKPSKYSANRTIKSFMLQNYHSMPIITTNNLENSEINDEN